jgi:hypothetical protein
MMYKAPPITIMSITAGMIKPFMCVSLASLEAHDSIMRHGDAFATNG